jgi:L-fuconolactonase
VQEAGRSVDIVGSETITLGAALAAKLPDLRIILDHLPLENVATAELRRCAERPRLFVKVSNVMAFQPERLAELWEVFGPQRLLFASNWPVSARWMPYAKILATLRQFLAQRSAADARDFFSETAARVYRWPHRESGPAKREAEKSRAR